MGEETKTRDKGDSEEATLLILYLGLTTEISHHSRARGEGE